MNMRFSILLFFKLLLCITQVSAQHAASWSFGANPYYGGVFRYKPEMPQLQLSNLYGIELYTTKITDGSRRWEKLFNYPHIGFAASYFNYGVSKELGSVYSLTSYLDMSANNRKKNQWRLNIGTGFVYSTQTYHGIKNPGNKAVSSRISYVIRGTIHHEIKLTDQYYFNFNVAFRHYSNGRLNVPNNGMNFPVAGVGVRYVPKPQPIDYLRDTLKHLDPKIRFNIMTGTAWREVLREDYKHRAYSLSAYMSKQITNYNNILAGLDGFLYGSESVRKAVAVYNEQEGITADKPLPDDGRQMAITIGTELLLGKMIVILQGGFYVYKPQVYYTSSWYQRYGFKYMITQKFFPQITLKSHSRTADMVEFGFGFSF